MRAEREKVDAADLTVKTARLLGVQVAQLAPHRRGVAREPVSQVALRAAEEVGHPLLVPDKPRRVSPRRHDDARCVVTRTTSPPSAATGTSQSSIVRGIGFLAGQWQVCGALLDRSCSSILVEGFQTCMVSAEQHTSDADKRLPVHVDAQITTVPLVHLGRDEDGLVGQRSLIALPRATRRRQARPRLRAGSAHLLELLLVLLLQPPQGLQRAGAPGEQRLDVRRDGIPPSEEGRRRLTKGSVHSAAAVGVLV